MVSNGFLPGWALANDAWPLVCQSCVTTTLSKPAAMRLMTGTTSSPFVTGKVPPLTKQFCTSMTSSALAASGLILPLAATARPPAATAANRPRPACKIARREMVCMMASFMAWGGESTRGVDAADLSQQAGERRALVGVEVAEREFGDLSCERNRLLDHALAGRRQADAHAAGVA